MYFNKRKLYCRKKIMRTSFDSKTIHWQMLVSKTLESKIQWQILQIKTILVANQYKSTPKNEINYGNTLKWIKNEKRQNTIYYLNISSYKIHSFYFSLNVSWFPCFAKKNLISFSIIYKVYILIIWLLPYTKIFWTFLYTIKTG